MSETVDDECGQKAGIGVPVTGMEPKGEVAWCLTRGWGNLSRMETGWNRAMSFEDAAREIAKIARKEYPARFREVWTYSYLEDGSGVVCDFGDYTYFGFVRGKCDLRAPAPEVPEEKPGRPEKECSAPEYLQSDDGASLTEKMGRYFSEANVSSGSWWQAHALEYCLVSEWWSMFTEDEPSIREIWDYAMSPSDIVNHVIRWAKNDPDGAEILLQSSPDARWDAFHMAFTWGEE